MKVRYRKRFIEDLAKIPSQNRKAIEKFAFKDVPKLSSLSPW